MSEIDQAEMLYKQEYEALVEKDKKEGRDFNWLAFEEYKQMEFQWKFLRE